MYTLAHDCVGLPVIVIDCSAQVPTRRYQHPQTWPESPDKASSILSETTTSSPGTLFADFANDLWSRMATATKVKLRDACLEVLRRTDDREGLRWQCDDDARFLD